MEIINRDVNFDGTCQRVNSERNICTINQHEVDKLSSIFNELRNDGKSISSLEDLTLVNEKVKKEKLAKMRVLKKEENGGFILISSLTSIGILIVGATIFMTIKLLIIG